MAVSCCRSSHYWRVRRASPAILHIFRLVVPYTSAMGDITIVKRLLALLLACLPICAFGQDDL